MRLLVKFRHSLPMGLICALVGGLAGLWVTTTATGDGYGVFIIAAPIAAFLTGMFSWWLLVARPGRRSLLRGAAAGTLAALLGHFLCWYLILVGAYVWYQLGGPWNAIGGPPGNPLVAIAAAGAYGAFSLLFIGWVTVPCGALLGGLLAVVQNRRVEPPRTAA
jgi:hypothetical protein